MTLSHNHTLSHSLYQAAAKKVDNAAGPMSYLKCDRTSAMTRALRSSLLSEGRCSKICALPRLLVMMMTQFLKLTV